MAIIAQSVSPADPVLAMLVTHRSVAFSLPPLALGFATEVEEAVSLLNRIGSPYYVNGAFSVEGQYLEPTIGQIWPR
jgi:hypothetical protein